MEDILNKETINLEEIVFYQKDIVGKIIYIAPNQDQLVVQTLDEQIILFRFLDNKNCFVKQDSGIEQEFYLRKFCSKTQIAKSGNDVLITNKQNV